MQDTAKYIKLYLNPLSRWPRAYSNRKENYVWQYGIDPDRHLCEIIFIQEGSISEMLPSGEKNYPQGSVYTVVHDSYRRNYCKQPVYHEFMLRFFVYTPYERMSEEDVANWVPETHYAILPECITDPAVCEQISKLLKNAVRIYQQDNVSRMLRMQAILCECLSILTEQAVLQAKQHLMHQADSYNRITKRICKFIDKHLPENITVRDMAKAISANYDYAARIFRRDMNMSILEYWNRSRIHKVEQLITVESMNLADAGAAVGIPDTKYLSRLFHRYTGMTVPEFRHIFYTRSNNGMDLEK